MEPLILQVVLADNSGIKTGRYDEQLYYNIHREAFRIGES